MSIDTSTIVGINVTASVVGIGLGWLMMRKPSSPVVNNPYDYSRGHKPSPISSIYQRPIHSNNNNRTVKLWDNSSRANSISSRNSRNSFHSVNSGDYGFYDTQEGPERGGKKKKNKKSFTKRKFRS